MKLGECSHRIMSFSAGFQRRPLLLPGQGGKGQAHQEAQEGVRCGRGMNKDCGTYVDRREIANKNEHASTLVLLQCTCTYTVQ